MIRLFVGLGNPGAEYADTRHNAGVWLVEALAKTLKASPWRLESKFFGQVCRARVNGEECWLLLPQTYMNLSGQAIGAMARYYKITPEEICIAHDELDFAPGVVKLKQGGGHGGHNGLKDSISKLNSAAFWRLRLGIGHPGDRNEVAHFVLHTPRIEERNAIEAAITRATALLTPFIQGDSQGTVRALHAPLSPEKAPCTPR